MRRLGALVAGLATRTFASALAAVAPFAASAQVTRSPSPDTLQVAHVGRVTAVGKRADLPLAITLAEEAGALTTFPGLGRIDPDPLTIIVVHGDSAWQAVAHGRAPRWGAAITLEGPRTIVLRADAGDWSRVLHHELAHLAMHQSVHVPLPRWFDEGYASVAAGEWERLEALTLSAAVLHGDVTTLSALDGRLHDGTVDPATAYALAMSATNDLARRNHSGTLTPLLDLLRQGVPFDEAVLRSTGLTIDRFDEAWAKETRRRYSVFTWLIAGGGWAFVAIVVLLLARRRRQQDAPRRAQLDVGWPIPEDEEQKELDLDPPP